MFQNEFILHPTMSTYIPQISINSMQEQCEASAFQMVTPWTEVEVTVTSGMS